MTRFGYTLMTEQSGPKELVRYAVSAEQVGFDFEVSSDHFSPWLTSQGHAPNAWTMLGAVAHATERVDLYTYVTCPTMRYHPPAVVAQQAATLQILADGRFTLGLGSGENLNEHVVGRGWPTIQRRQDMLKEAIAIIRELLSGELVDYKGEYFQVDSARIWDVPDVPVTIGVAVSGERSLEAFATASDHMIAVEPDGKLVDGWHGARQATGLAGGGRVIGQIRCAGIPIVTPRSNERTSSSAGSAVAGMSTPTCRPRPGSRALRSTSPKRTSPKASPADRIWTPSSKRSVPTGRPGSPISHWCRSAMRAGRIPGQRRRAAAGQAARGGRLTA